MRGMTQVGEQSVVAYLGNLKPLFVDKCKKEGVSASEGLRQLVVEALQTRETSYKIEPDEPEEVCIGVQVRFTPSELAAAKACAIASGLSLQKWYASLLRGYLTRLPQFGQYELEALGESNRRLAQMVRQLRGSEFASIGESNRWDDVVSELRKHLKHVAVLITCNRDRWRLSPDD